MADEGFTIEDMLPLGIKLNIPAFLASLGQMSPKDVVKTLTVTSLSCLLYTSPSPRDA